MCVCVWWKDFFSAIGSETKWSTKIRFQFKCKFTWHLKFTFAMVSDISQKWRQYLFFSFSLIFFRFFLYSSVFYVVDAIMHQNLICIRSQTRNATATTLECYCYSSHDPIDFVFMQQNGNQISRRKHIFNGNCFNEKNIVAAILSEQLVPIQLAHVLHFKPTCNICHSRFVMFDFLRYLTFLPLITICICFFCILINGWIFHEIRGEQFFVANWYDSCAFGK